MKGDYLSKSEQHPVIVKRAICQPVAITASDFIQYCVLILNSKQIFATTRIIGVYVCVYVYVCVCICTRVLGIPVGVRNYRSVLQR